MATTANIPLNGSPKGVQFRMTVSLGNVIQIVVLCAMALMGWTTIQNRQQEFIQQQAEQAREIHTLTDRMEMSAELNARQAAIVDGLEKRIARLEGQLDRGK